MTSLIKLTSTAKLQYSKRGVFCVLNHAIASSSTTRYQMVMYPGTGNYDASVTGAADPQSLGAVTGWVMKVEMQGGSLADDGLLLNLRC
jgi:hypothetical protein